MPMPFSRVLDDGDEHGGRHHGAVDIAHSCWPSGLARGTPTPPPLGLPVE